MVNQEDGNMLLDWRRDHKKGIAQGSQVSESILLDDIPQEFCILLSAYSTSKVHKYLRR
jgi:hypothetical protein